MSTLPLLNEAELDKNFINLIKEIPGGEKISNCIQCGTCSGTCPASFEMEYTPRKMMLMAAIGMKKEILHSRAIWLCASCYACTVRCPRGIPVTDIIYVLKNMAVLEGKVDKKISGADFYQSFNRMVLKKGRVNEGVLMALHTLRTEPAKLFSLAPLGLKMLRRGRMHLTMPRMKNREEFHTVMARVRGDKQ